MMQTMHTMPAGIGAGHSGYGTHDPASAIPENATYKTSIGFFDNQNSGSTPIGGG
jgi:hypothetical protein